MAIIIICLEGGNCNKTQKVLEGSKDLSQLKHRPVGLIHLKRADIHSPQLSLCNLHLGFKDKTSLGCDTGSETS